MLLLLSFLFVFVPLLSISLARSSAPPLYSHVRAHFFYSPRASLFYLSSPLSRCLLFYKALARSALKCRYFALLLRARAQEGRVFFIGLMRKRAAREIFITRRIKRTTAAFSKRWLGNCDRPTALAIRSTGVLFSFVYLFLME